MPVLFVLRDVLERIDAFAEGLSYGLGNGDV